MNQYFAFARNNRSGRSRASTSGTPSGAMMDRAGRIYILPWSRKSRLAELQAWYTQIARRLRSWWRGRGA
jgi:hypothetical protein